MAALQMSRLKILTSSMKSGLVFDVRPTFAYTSRCFHSIEFRDMRRSIFPQYKSNFANVLLGNSGFPTSVSFAGFDPLVNRRLFSSASNGGGVGGDDLFGKFKQVWQSTVGAAKCIEEKAKEVSNEVAPHAQQWLDGHPYLKDVIVPVSGTLLAALLVWSFFPRLFRRFHKYSVEGPGALLSGSSLWGPVSYEKSFWGALELPVRYFITAIAMLEIVKMVAPTYVDSQYVAQAWKGVLVVSLVWFLNRWKTNVIARALAAKNIERIRRDNLLALNNISSVGLFVIGSMFVAEACGVAVQSILTLGGVGGVATAFAARDILGNILSGLFVQIAQPFSVGDTIKAGSVEGQVMEMGLTTTSMLTAEKFPVIVPNSLFSSQVIVNKSRAEWRSMVKTVPLQIEDVDKIPQISEDIKSMLVSNSNVFLESEAPYCFLSQIERSYAELTIGCNLKLMNKEAEQDILLKAVCIIKQHGALLGRTHGEAIN